MKSRAQHFVPFVPSWFKYLSLRLALPAVILCVTNYTFGQEPAADGKPAAAEKPAVADAAKTPGTPSATDELSVEQARLADRYKRLEEVVGRLAELSASSDPRRAKLLRDAIAQSREQDINVRFESIVKLLQDERLSVAATNQTELQKELDGLLTMLLKADRDKEINSERERVKAYLKEVGRLIREQKGVRARTEGGDDLKALGADQKRIAGDTGKLGGSISKTDGEKKNADGKSGDKGDKDGKPANSGDKKPGDSKDGEKKDGEGKQGDKKDGEKSPNPNQPKPDDQQKPGEPKSGEPSDSAKPGEGQPAEGQPGKPSEGQPSQSKPSQGQPGPPQEGGESKPPGEEQQQPQDPADRATDQLKKAQHQMEAAQKKLEEAQRKGAGQAQQQAIKELELAKAELERVLRQLREEELERTLTQLAARFRKMLEMQTAVYDGTLRLDKVPQAQRTHDHEIDSARLSRDESQIVHEVDKALSLLHEEGSSVAFPEAVDQMRDDMKQVTERLAGLKVDKLTQRVEEEIIESLEETISALDKSIKDLEQKRTPPGQQPQAGQPQDMPLVDKLAELKMIRSLQARINSRTKLYGEMIKGEQAEAPEMLKALHDLSDRQQRVYKATADLQQEKNE